VLLDLYAATQKENLLNRRESLEKGEIDLLQQLLDLGEISANELSLARVTYEQTRLARLDENKRKVQARMQLAAAIGVPARALETIKFSFDVLEGLAGETPTADAQRKAMLNREDLLAAMADYQASQAALQLEVARQFPNVHLGPGYEFDQSEDKWMLGLSLNLPIFNQNKGAIAMAEARREQAAAQFMAVQARIIAEIEQAAASYRGSLRKVEAAERLSNELQDRVERLTKMYEAGAVVRLNVIAAQLEMNTNAINRLDARVEALKALGELEDAMHAASDLPDWSNRMPPERTEHVGNQNHD
jgi:outer membrane protein TolC